MKLKYKFAINKVAGRYIAVPLWESVSKFKGAITLNETGSYILEQLGNDITYEELKERIKEHFSCTDEEAKENADYMINGLNEANLLTE